MEGKYMFNRKKIIATLIIVGALSLTIGAVPALAASLSNIADVNANPVKDTEVTVTGTVKSVDGNEYAISDATGTITVEAGPRWYQAVDLAVGEIVSVTGEVDTGKDGTKIAAIDAFSITKADGSIITVKGAGKPPWAGGPNAAARLANRGK
jgi:uncharacterized protein YdeI (BOF family)